MDNGRKALKAGIWYTISNFIVKGLIFFTTPVFTRLLTKTEFGLYHNYSSCLQIMTVFVTLNLESTLISARFDFEDRFDDYIFSIMGLSTLSAVIWLVLVNVFRLFFTGWWNLEIRYINAMLYFLLFSPVVLLFQDRERYLFEYRKSVLISLVVSLGASLLSVLLALRMENRLDGLILGSILPTVVVGLGLYAFFFRKVGRIQWSDWRYALPICIPYIPHILSLNVLNAIDKMMITRWCGAEQNAVYSLAYLCGSVVSLLTISLNSAYAPWLGEKLSDNTRKSREEVRTFSIRYISGFLIVAVGIMAVAPEVLYFLGGQKYLEAKYVLPPVAMGCVCQFLYTMFVNVEQFQKKTIAMAFASAAAALVNYVLNCIFIPRFGYLAAAYTTLAGYVCLLLIHMILVKRLALDSVYDYPFVLFAVLLGMVMMVFLTMLYRANGIRLLFVAVYCIGIVMFLVRKRTAVMLLLRSLRR